MAVFKEAPTVETIVAAPAAEAKPWHEVHAETILMIVFVLAVALLFYGFWPRQPRKRDYEKYHPDNFGKGRRVPR